MLHTGSAQKRGAGDAHLEGRDVDDLLAGVGVKNAQHGQLSADGLARPSGCTQQHALIRVVQRMERLCTAHYPQILLK